MQKTKGRKGNSLLISFTKSGKSLSLRAVGGDEAISLLAKIVSLRSH